MRTLLLLFAISISLSSFAQFFNHKRIEVEPTELIATYTLKLKPDSTNLDFFYQEEMLLFIGQNVSKFISLKKYCFDTIMLHVNSHDQLQALLSDRTNPLPFSRVSYSIFKRYPKGKLTFIEHSLDGTFKFEENLDLFNWQIRLDTMTIGTFKVQKATTNFGGRKWIAWFSTNIPINDGPYKFNGLPGLIVKIYDSRGHYNFELKTIEKPEKLFMIDYRDKEYINTTKEKFFRAKDAFRADIMSRLKEKGAAENSQQVAARNMKKRNNPIELKRK